MWEKEKEKIDLKSSKLFYLIIFFNVNIKMYKILIIFL